MSMDSHLIDQRIEDVDFLIENGLSKREACLRVGVAVSTYEKRKVEDAR